MTAPTANSASNPTPPPPASAPAPTPTPSASETGLTEQQKRTYAIVGGLVALCVLAALALLAYWLVNAPAQAAAWRDVFIIFMALEFMVIGVALVVLIVQIAVLTNMLRHEIKPILESTNETVNTVRGTALFVSENLVEPIMKLNSYVAALASVMDTISAFTGLGRRK